MGVPKLQHLGLLQLWRRITSCADLWLQRGLKQTYSPRRELSNNMSHIACTQGNWVDSQLLVVGSQIANLTPNLSFGHNLCYRCPNEQCKPILDIHTSIAFQWYKESFKARFFDPCNHALKIRESFQDSNSQHGSSLVSVRVHSLTLFCTPGSMWSDFQVSFLARNLVSPCFGRESKARVTTLTRMLLVLVLFLANLNMLLAMHPKATTRLKVITFHTRGSVLLLYGPS